jgi:catechol 2,3-dioxygenase-like lactoylglutathione lyase family enzyme
MRFHHIAKVVDNIADSVDWYLKNLGAKVLKQDDDWAMLQLDSLTLALTLPGKHPDHIAFEVDNLSDFPCPPNEIKCHRDGSFFYYQEIPDGTVIEWLYWDTPQKL